MKDLMAECFKTARRNGFYEFPDTPESVSNAVKAQHLALIHGEVSECLEAVRQDRYTRGNMEHVQDVITEKDTDLFVEGFEKYVKNTVEDEVVDILLRTLNFASFIGMKDTLEAHISMKMRYNDTRPYKHGKKF